MIEWNSHYVYAKNLLISDIVIIHVFVILFNLQVTLFITEPWQWNMQIDTSWDMHEMNAWVISGSFLNSGFWGWPWNECMGESFQDYSCIQDFEADFL